MASISSRNPLDFKEFVLPTQAQLQKFAPRIDPVFIKAIFLFLTQHGKTIRDRARDQQRTITATTTLFKSTPIQFYPNGSYYLLFLNQSLGTGSYKNVFKGVSDEGIPVAIAISDKVLEAEKETSTIDLLVDERKNLEVVREHPNFVHIIDSCEQSFISEKKIAVLQTTIVLEYCNLGNLAQFSQKQDNRSPLWKKNFLVSVLSGLAWLHERGWIHRDIKPANIFVSKKPELFDEEFRIGDLGSMCLMSDHMARLKHRTTEIFSPPEYATTIHLEKIFDQISGKLCDTVSEKLISVDGTTCAQDNWAVGCIFYELLGKDLPWHPKKPTHRLQKQTAEEQKELSRLNPISHVKNLTNTTLYFQSPEPECSPAWLAFYLLQPNPLFRMSAQEVLDTLANIDWVFTPFETSHLEWR